MRGQPEHWKGRGFVLLLMSGLVIAAPEIGAGEPAAAPTDPTRDQVEREIPAELAASNILIQWKGLERARPHVLRTKERALALAREMTSRARAGEDFAELAREYTDGPSGIHGGYLGFFPPDRYVPEFSGAVMALEIGEISDPVETRYGYHVILREKVERFGIRHVLIMHEQARRTTVSRSREEALQICREVLKKARAGEDFAELARSYSDGPTRTSGGDLGLIGRASYEETFAEAAFTLEVGQISDVVETPFGYHIIYRYQ